MLLVATIAVSSLASAAYRVMPPDTNKCSVEQASRDHVCRCFLSDPDVNYGDDRPDHVGDDQCRLRKEFVASLTKITHSSHVTIVTIAGSTGMVPIRISLHMCHYYCWHGNNRVESRTPTTASANRSIKSSRPRRRFLTETARRSVTLSLRTVVVLAEVYNLLSFITSTLIV